MSFDLSFHSIDQSVCFFDAAPQAAAAPEQGLEQTFIMLLLAMVFFYFIMWRPEKKRRKELEAKRNALKKGDTIVVAGGIICEVVRIQADRVLVKLADGAKMEVLKAAVQEILQVAPQEKESE